MSITTGKGDKGKTSLYPGGNVYKDDIRIETYGVLDELCSSLGFSKSLIRDRKAKSIIETIQKDLFILGTEVGAGKGSSGTLRKYIGGSDIRKLEEKIAEYEKRGNLRARCFYLPGENMASASLDISRTAARRLERRAVTLLRRGLLDNHNITVYLNRASDLLYLIARSLEKARKKKSGKIP